MSDAMSSSGRDTGAAGKQGREPIAIIGIGCRFPGGADSPEAFWENLKNGVNAIRDVPADRWDLISFFDPEVGKPGKTYTRKGGFLDQIDQFDAAFFGISPREAVSMDPQQRLLLEVAYEALEDGGQPVESLSGSKTGVFVGISTHDYADIHVKDIYTGNSYTNSGGALSIAANRVSYTFNLVGPSMAVDTACSSSLVAVHLACRSIWDGESQMAIAGGVNCILTPEPTIGFSKANMLSPDGECRTFDASANGYVRGEGAGAIVMKPLSQALADGDPVYAVIRSTGVNQDGHTHGLTVPSQESQEALLRDVYGQAGISADEVFYVEAHGTGTPVGDPIEANAIGNALGVGRSGAPLRVGSVKTNIGHLEAASGMAGLIKAAMAIKRRQLPPNLHFSEPNPRIPFDELRLQVQRKLESWPAKPDATVIGINSFGFGGTNAHVVLDQAPAAEDDQRTVEFSPAPRNYLLPLSAANNEALQAQAKTYADFLAPAGAGSQVRLADIAYTLGARRSQHETRLALTAASHAEAIEQLEAFLAGETRAGMSTGRQISGRSLKLAFVFSGMGPQWWGMGRQLLETEPVFRRAVEECDRLFMQHADWSLIDELSSDATRSRMDETEFAQPCNFALQVGLAALWRSWGITPNAIVGHSAGEVAAVYEAGILSLEDAVLVIYNRSRLQQRATGTGRMLAVGLSPAEATAELNGSSHRVSLAAINSPRAVTLSGDADALEDIARVLESRRVFARFMDVAVPYHSHHMDPLKDELIETLSPIAPRVTSVPYYSVVSGEPTDGTDVDATYWWRNVRQPVEFSRALECMLEDGFDAFVEVSPHPVLARSIVEAQQDRSSKAPVVPSLRRDGEDRAIMLGSLGTLYTLGCQLNWRNVNPGEVCEIKLPGYPWQRERHWDESDVSAVFRLGKIAHPLLERRIDSAIPAWETRLDGQRIAYLTDHRIQGNAVYPAAAYIEMALAAGKAVNGDGTYVVEDIEFKRPLAIPGADGYAVQLSLDPQENTFNINSHARGSMSWMLHSTGRVQRERTSRAVAPVTVDKIKRRMASELKGERCYEVLGERGLQYGPYFQGIEHLWLGNREALGRIVMPEGVTADQHYVIHPSLLDACFQVLIGAVFADQAKGASRATYLPVKIDRLRLIKAPAAGGFWSHATLTKLSSSSLEGDFVLIDDDGQVAVEISGLRCQALPDARAARLEDLTDCLYDLQWLPKTLAGDTTQRQAGFLASPKQIAAAMPSASELNERCGLEEHAQVAPQIELLAAAYALEALTGLGWKPVRGRRVAATTLSKRLGLPAEAGTPISRLLRALAHAGFLDADEAGWTVVRTAVDCNASTLSESILEKQPQYEGVLSLLQGSVSQITSERCPGSDEAASEEATTEDEPVDAVGVVDDSPYGSAYASVAAEAVKTAVRSLPMGRAVRVLQVGGRSGVAASMLAALPRNKTAYVFTDASNEGFPFAKQRLADHACVDFQVLDIDRDPEAQGFAAGSFDLVITTGALSRSNDAEGALASLKALLASDGVLLAIEPARASAALSLIEGPAAATLDEATIPAMFKKAGFRETTRVETGADTSQAVFVARAPHVETSAPEVATSQGGPGSRWLIFADGQGFGDRLANQLKALGDRPVIVCSGDEYRQVDDEHYEICAEKPQDMAALIQSVATGQPALRGIVHLWSLDAPDPATARIADLQAATQKTSINVLQLVQTLARSSAPTQARLWLVTRGVQDTGDEAPTGITQAALWGFGRVVMNEHPHLRTTLVDLDPSSPESEITSLVRELRADDQEQEVCLRSEARYISRVVRSAESEDKESGAKAASKSGPFYLDVARPGSLESLELREKRRKKPAAGEVEIEVFAAGLNFRDVMKAMSLYPSEEGDPFWLGDECSGRVVRVGDGVTDLKAGDDVVAVAPGCFGSFVTVPSLFVAKKPAHISYEQAAGIPIVFLTTHYALNHQAKISSEDRVLIHSAAGGVGMSAVQLAQRAGSEIFATAGSPEKRDLLRSFGIKHVMDSRSLDFADETMKITGGKGVSVVLNSLAGDFIPKSIGLLEPTGRFLELGKIDLYQNSKLGLYPFRSGLSFFTIDMGWLLQHRPQLSKSLLSELMAMFESRELEPLPVQTFSISEASKAFRFMAQARHTGKIVLTLTDKQPPRVVPAPVKKPLFRTDGTYLITGGLGGFGLAIAQWMVEQGAKNLVLAGRSGIGSPEAEQAVARMQAAGARIEIAKADAGREEDVSRVIAEIDRSMPPLRGVFHAAMVLDDGYLLQLDETRFQRVTAPKMDGAWNLHLATLDKLLDYFVCFSSLASWAGSVGQGNYAAANAFLDALAKYRHSLGLAALTVNWGAIAEVGYVARNPDIGRQLDRQGFPGLKPQEATAILGQLLRSDAPEAGAIRVDFASMAATFSGGAAYRRFSHLLQQAPKGDAAGKGEGARRGDLIERLRAAAPEEQLQRLEAMLRREVSTVLGIPAARLDAAQDLSSLGLDSLMSVELEMALEAELGADLPLGFFLGEEISLKYLSQRLREQIEVLTGAEGGQMDGALATGSAANAVATAG